MSTNLLRPSRVLNKLRAGQVASCTKLNLADPRVVEIAALSGLDCVWLDLEHVPSDMRDIENGIRAAKMHDCDVLVRVARGSYSDMIRPLEMDASGIMVPHVFTGEETQQIARQTRFHPIGLRPLDGGNADGAYCMVPMQAYIEHCNTNRFVVVQIEDPEALEHLDAIAQVPGIDMLFFGPGDFTHALGIPGQFDDPRIDKARRAVADAAKHHGKFAGTVGSLSNKDALIDLGYQFLSLSADVVMLSQGFTSIAKAFNPKLGDGSSSGVYRM